MLFNIFFLILMVPKQSLYHFFPRLGHYWGTATLIGSLGGLIRKTTNKQPLHASHQDDNTLV